MKKILLLLLTLIFVVCMVGCADNNEKVENSTLDIVTSFYPMYVATANIVDGAEGVTLKNLASPEVGCLHDYQLTTNDMITLENAEVFIINGGGMESFLDKATSAYPDLKVINASEEIFEGSSNYDDDGHLHSSEHKENSHVWVSISLHIKQIERICEELKTCDSKNAEIYEKNKSEYIKKLEELKEEMQTEIAKLENRNIVTFHEAFEYFADDFDLNVVAVIEREPGTSPSAGELAEIIEKISNGNADAIFTEPQYSKTAATTIATETGILLYELDPIVSGTLNKDAYIDKMKNNLEVLMEALKNE